MWYSHLHCRTQVNNIIGINQLPNGILVFPADHANLLKRANRLACVQSDRYSSRGIATLLYSQFSCVVRATSGDHPGNSLNNYLVVSCIKSHVIIGKAKKSFKLFTVWQQTKTYAAAEQVSRFQSFSVYIYYKKSCYLAVPANLFCS